MKTKNKALVILFIFLSTFLSFTYFYFSDNIDSLDNRVRDFYFKFRGAEKTDDSIVIVDIDEKSIKELGQWPWERDKLSQILQNLTNSGAGIIGLDMVFSESDKTSPLQFSKKWDLNISDLPDYDLILAQTIKDTPTILSYVFDFSSQELQSEPPQIPAIFIEKNKGYGEFLPKAKGVLTNIDTIQDSAYSSGYMNTIPDSSGIIRSVPLMIKYNDMIYPSLAFEMYRIALNSNKVTLNYSASGIEYIVLANQKIKSDRFARIHLNFRGPSKSYKYISAVDVYNNDIKKEDVDGKFILLGTSAYGLMDLRSTPMDSVIPGVEVHANIIDNLIHNDMLLKPSLVEIVDLSLIILLSAIIFFILSRFSIAYISFGFIALLAIVIYFNYYLLFTQLIIINSIFPIISMFLSLTTVLGVNFMFEFQQKEVIKNSFSKKVSKQVMDDLLSNPDDVNLSSKEVYATIYFSDIRNFTTISEKLKSPKLITEFLNFYMNTMVESIENSSGTIDKFIGDAIMAYWNAPVAIENHVDKALLSAIEQVEKREELNKIIVSKYNFTLDYGIGINTGKAVVGEIGSNGRSDYTIIGDSVNLASRLEGLCKLYKVRLIISEYTKDNLINDYVIQLLDIVRVKGKTEAVKIYEVLCKGLADKDKADELQQYNLAHDLYLNSKFDEAKKIFNKLYTKYNKFLYKLYTQRCDSLIQNNIKDFDGVFDLEKY